MHMLVHRGSGKHLAVAILSRIVVMTVSSLTSDSTGNVNWYLF